MAAPRDMHGNVVTEGMNEDEWLGAFEDPANHNIISSRITGEARCAFCGFGGCDLADLADEE